MSAVDARLAALEARLSALEARVNEGAGASSGGGSNGSSGDKGGRVASDRELDGPYGDFIVKKDPKRWVDNGGASFAGCKLSECPSDFLEELAGLYDWMADKDEEKGKTWTNKKGEAVPTAPMTRSNAARARGWAKRNKNKAAAPASSSSSADTPADDFGSYTATDDDIPF